MKDKIKSIFKSNFLDKSCNGIIKLMITVGLILLLLLWGVVPIIFLYLLGIDYTNMNSYLKVFLTFINDLILILIFFLIYKKNIIESFKSYFNKDFSKNISTSFKYWGIGLSIMIISNLIISLILNGSIASNEQSVRDLIDKYPIYMAFQVIIYAPLTEEIIFRKSIYDITSNKYIYIILSGLIFGFMHVITSVENITELLYLIPYSSLGFAFAALYYKTKNIFSSVIVHAFHNALSFTLYLLMVML